MALAGTSRRAARFASCLTLLAGMVSLLAAPAQQSAERALTVDFYALGPDGISIADLKADEVAIKLDGRTRPVQSLRLV